MGARASNGAHYLVILLARKNVNAESRLRQAHDARHQTASQTLNQPMPLSFQELPGEHV